MKTQFVFLAVLLVSGMTFAADAPPVKHHHRHHRQKAVEPAPDHVEPALPAAQTPSQPQAAAEPAVLPASLPFKRDTDAGTGLAAIPVAMLSGIALLGAVLIAVRYQLSKRGGGKIKPSGGANGWIATILPKKSAPGVRVISSVPLSRGSHLHVIEWRETQYLLAGGENGFTVIERIQDAGNSGVQKEQGAAA